MLSDVACLVLSIIILLQSSINFVVATKQVLGVGEHTKVVHVVFQLQHKLLVYSKSKASTSMQRANATDNLVHLNTLGFWSFHISLPNLQKQASPVSRKCTCIKQRFLSHIENIFKV